MIEGLLDALLTVLTWPGPLLMVAGVLFGLLFGVLPGVGGTPAMALLIPLTFGMDPRLALAFLLAANVSAGLGGQITAILVNIPGDAPNAATTLDGYAMARQGRAPEALGAATTGSVIGAIIGTILLILMVPVARGVILSFSYPEFFMIALTGLTLIAVLTRGRTYKGLISAGIGLMIAFIGLNPVTGTPRFTFDQLYLWDGIGIVPILIGLFAGSEVLSLFGKRRSVMEIRPEDEGGRESRFVDGIVSTLRAWKTVAVSSVLGFAVGLVPGVGGTVASFLAYGQAARMSGRPGEFGKGRVEGVIAAETANDADKSGSLLPTIAFGIPGGVAMAVLLGALILHGVPAGPNLLRNHIDVVYVLIIASIIPRILAAGVVSIIGARAIWFTRIPGEILAPLIVTMALVGVFSLRNQILDVVTMIIFGYVGYAMERHGFSRVSLVIAVILGGIMESAFHQTLATFGPLGFFVRPISLVLFIVALLSLAVPIGRTVASRRRPTCAD